MAQRTVVRTAALLGALSFVIAGCGGGNTTGRESASGGPSVRTCEPAQATASGRPSTAPVKIGTLLSETGSLAILDPPEIAAVDVFAGQHL